MCSSDVVCNPAAADELVSGLEYEMQPRMSCPCSYLIKIGTHADGQVCSFRHGLNIGASPSDM